jgi:hypothetical protein
MNEACPSVEGPVDDTDLMNEAPKPTLSGDDQEGSKTCGKVRLPCAGPSWPGGCIQSLFRRTCCAHRTLGAALTGGHPSLRALLRRLFGRQPLASAAGFAIYRCRYPSAPDGHFIYEQTSLSQIASCLCY